MIGTNGDYSTQNLSLDNVGHRLSIGGRSGDGGFRCRFQVCNRNKVAVSLKNLFALSVSLSDLRNRGMKVFLLPSWMSLFS
jgi:hypothetical protein